MGADATEIVAPITTVVGIVGVMSTSKCCGDGCHGSTVCYVKQAPVTKLQKTTRGRE